MTAEMRAETNMVISGTIFILLFGIFTSFIISNYHRSTELSENTARGSWACTADVKVCPDGTEVTRTPPYCHFASCVGE